MSLDLIKFAFVAGEISPNYFGRPDLEKFDLALALGENWFVDYRGGVSTRAGTEFLDYIMYDDRTIKLVDFKFSSDIANTYVLVLGDLYIRFVQDGAYVVHNARNISNITQANPAVVTTSTNHSLQNGDWVKIAGVIGPNNVNGDTFIVANKTNTTFQLHDPFGNNFSTIGAGAYVSSGVVSRIYTVVSPWNSQYLDDLRVHQIRDNLRFTHKNFKPRNLNRVSATSWTLTQIDFNNTAAIPTGISHTVVTAGGWAILYAITAVDIDGIESLPSTPYVGGGVESPFQGTTLSWTPVVGAIYYNVYASRLSTQNSISRGMSVGFIGRTSGATFNNTDIIPDFTRTPPNENNPFADQKIDWIDVTNGGAGYSNASTFSVVDGGGGTGFIGYLVIATSYATSTGPVRGVAIRSGGSDYVNPIAIVGAPGAGATFSFHISAASGNNPSVGTIFQQRQVYAATENQPLTIFGSRPLRLSDFGGSQVTLANDSYEHDIDNDSVAPIRHLVPTRGGLIVINENGIWLLSGSQGRAVTATDAQADSQAYKGSTELVPLKIDTDLLYQEGSGGSVRLLSYNDINKVYSGTDMSVLANHLFGTDKRIMAWAYSDEPFKLVWAQREDGTGLSFTMLKEQSVYAWMRQTTKGLFRDMLAIQEDRKSRVYTVVERYINGRWSKFLERFTARDFAHVEDAWCVDAGLQLSSTVGTTTLTIAAVSGDDVLVTSSAAYFVSGDVNKILRACGGKMRVITYINDVTIHVKVLRELTEVLPQTNPVMPMLASVGLWTLDTPQTILRGLRHLEGQTLKILADGNVQADKVVTNGTITLDTAATRIIVGLGYRCLLKTLPPTTAGGVIEDKRKRIVALAARIRETRGLTYGKRLDHLYVMKERTTEAWGEPTLLQEGMKTIMIEPQWDVESQMYIIQDNPLPATLLGFVMQTEVGDDDNSRAAD